MTVPDHVSQHSCPACHSTVAEELNLRCIARGEYAGNEVDFLVCGACGFVSAPGNTHPFESEGDFDETSTPLDEHGRVGTSSRPGREYFMASMAKDILSSAGLPTTSILVYGAGLSRDHQWLSAKLPGIKVYVSDLKNFQKVENFVPMEDQRTFDVVIACEVAEHFTKLEDDFKALLSKASPAGLVVLSTNISDGTPLERLPYPFVPGHTSYYSGRSLRIIAQRFDPTFRVDFRPPYAALGHLGPRKRYVLMYREKSIAPAVAAYFAENVMAPSEEPVFPTAQQRLFRWIGRKVRRHMSRTSGA